MDLLDFAIDVFNEEFEQDYTGNEKTALLRYSTVTISNVQRKKRRQSKQGEHQLTQIQLPRPRILKGDFRRNYPLMWANVYNSCDYEQMMLHLYTHYERDVTLQLRDLRPPEIRRLFARPIPTPSTTTDGLSFLANVWFHSMNVAPDLVCTLKHTLLKVRSDGSYTIKCCFTLTGTKIVSLVKNNDPDSIKRFAHYQARAIEGKPKIDATSAAVAAVAPLEIKSLLDQAPSPTDQSTLCSNSDASLPINDIKASNENDFTDELTKYMAPASVLPDTGSISDNSRTVIVRNEADSSSDSNDPDNDTEVMQHAPQSKGPRSTTAGLTRSLRRKLRKAQQLKQKASSGSEWISEGQDVLRKGSNVQSNETEEQHQPPVVVVLTTALDTISSFEMEFNADSRVTAMVMYFIT